jgi:DNA primase
MRRILEVLIEDILTVKIPQHIIDEILARVDILEVVSEHVNLRRRGQNYFGLCPFHTEKTPSFSVNPAKGIFHCFGCKVGGNVITFLTLHDNISFVEAVEELARRTGVEIPKPSAQTARDATEQEVLIRANELARDFFYNTLKSRREAGTEAAWEFLASRNITPRIVDDHHLGYAPDQWDGLMKYAAAKNVAVQVLQRAGLVVPRETEDGYYDRFRHRVMFPIVNLSGKVVGFGGRDLSGKDDVPKYLNSPDTPVFQKSYLLYGIRQARAAVRKEGFAILVEGYTDALALWIAGFEQAVATLGTAFGEKQARLLGRYSSEVVLTYDGDDAGLRAALRTGDIVLSEGLQPRVLLMPEGEDPDSLVRGRGAEAFQDLLSQAPPFLQFKWDLAVQGSPMAPRGKSDRIRWVLESVAQIPKELDRNLALREVAEWSRMSESVLAKELSAQRRSVRRASAPETITTMTRFEVSAEDTPCLELLKILIQRPGLAARIFPHWTTDSIANKPLRKVIQDLESRYLKDAKIAESELVSIIDDPGLRNWIAEALVSSPMEEPERAAHDCLIRIQCLQKEAQVADLLMQVKDAEAERKDPGEYLLRISQMRQEIAALRHQKLWDITP